MGTASSSPEPRGLTGLLAQIRAGDILPWQDRSLADSEAPTRLGGSVKWHRKGGWAPVLGCSWICRLLMDGARAQQAERFGSFAAMCPGRDRPQDGPQQGKSTGRLPSLVPDTQGTPGKGDIKTTWKGKDSQRHQALREWKPNGKHHADWVSVTDIKIHLFIKQVFVSPYCVLGNHWGYMGEQTRCRLLLVPRTK